MKLYELDNAADFLAGGNGSDHVTTLYFSGLMVPMTCTTAEYCSGDSGWTNSWSNSVAKAKIRVKVVTSYR